GQYHKISDSDRRTKWGSPGCWGSALLSRRAKPEWQSLSTFHPYWTSFLLSRWCLASLRCSGFRPVQRAECTVQKLSIVIQTALVPQVSGTVSAHLLDAEITSFSILLQLDTMGQQQRCTAIGLSNKSVPLGRVHYLTPMLVRQPPRRLLI